MEDGSGPLNRRSLLTGQEATLKVVEESDEESVPGLCSHYLPSTVFRYRGVHGRFIGIFQNLGGGRSDDY